MTALAVVSLVLLAALGGLIGWAVTTFDDTATEAAQRRQTVIVDMPPPPSAPMFSEVPQRPPDEAPLTDGAADVPVPPPSALDPAEETAADQPSDGAPAEDQSMAPSAAHDPEVGLETDFSAADDPMSATAGRTELDVAVAPISEDAREELAAVTPPPEPTRPADPTSADDEPRADPPARAPPGVPRSLDEFRSAPVPDPGLIAASPVGPLPVIGADGRQPWQAYARHHEDTGTRPRIAIVLGRLGHSQSATHAAIQQLPGTVTLGFAPYAPNLTDWIAQARAAGHEVLLQIPMEPFNYPTSDPGPHTLLTSLSAEDNIGRLEWLLGRGSGYVGVTNFMGSRFTSSADHLRPVFGVLKTRGLLFLDARVSRNSVAEQVAMDLGVPNTQSSRFLDLEASRVAIDARLYELERIAKSAGSAVGIGFPYPVTIERLAAWAQSLDDKGIALVPVSALAAEAVQQ